MHFIIPALILAIVVLIVIIISMRTTIECQAYEVESLKHANRKLSAIIEELKAAMY